MVFVWGIGVCLCCRFKSRKHALAYVHKPRNYLGLVCVPFVHNPCLFRFLGVTIDSC